MPFVATLRTPTDFSIIDWVRMYLSTILNDSLRDIVSWTFCTTIKMSDVTETLNTK
ncbi:MAG: hypothetical protein ACSHX3_09185 [Litorimonas sp.]